MDQIQITGINQSMIQMNLNPNEMIIDESFEPCRVCQEPSSGWHCGAVTCEACKKFFLRSLTEDGKYKCVKNKNCLINRETRTQCQYCRYKKCKEVGMTNSENPNNPTIAEIFKAFPCSVCKASSSGLHFGAITCEGCKGFFRRSTKERVPEQYKCTNNRNCEILAETRNICKYCRFQQCLQAGMSVDKSRIGRQSNLFKQKISELQRNGLVPNSEYLNNVQKKTKVNKVNISLNINNDDWLLPKDNQFEMQPQNNFYEQNNQISSISSATTSNYVYYTNSQDLTSSDISLINFEQYGNNSYYDDQTIQQHQTNQIQFEQQHALTYLQINQPIAVQFQQISIDVLFDINTSNLIKSVHTAFIQFKYQILAAFQEQQQVQFMNQSFQPYSYDYDTQIVFDMFISYGNKFLTFIETIPSLLTFNNDDQNELIKNSIHTVILLILQQEYNCFNYFACDEIFNQKVLKLFPIFSNLNDIIINMRNSFQKFNLDEIEYSLYAIIIVVSPVNSNSNLIDFERISDTREKFASILNKYMQARRNEEATYYDLLLLITNLRKFNNLLSDGILDTCQDLMRKGLKAFCSFNVFTKVYLPKKIIN